MCLGRQGAGAVVAKARPEMRRARVRAGAQCCCLCACEWMTRTYQKFSKVSALVYVLYKGTIDRTFANLCVLPDPPRGRNWLRRERERERWREGQGLVTAC
jgi:hypothetical protein